MHIVNFSLLVLFGARLSLVYSNIHGRGGSCVMAAFRPHCGTVAAVRWRRLRGAAAAGTNQAEIVWRYFLTIVNTGVSVRTAQRPVFNVNHVNIVVFLYDVV